MNKQKIIESLLNIKASINLRYNWIFIGSNRDSY